jgi:hypothetical protein
VAVVVFGLLIGWQQWKIGTLEAQAEEASAKNEAEEYKRTIEYRQYERQLLEKEVEIKDSLRQLYIEEIEAANRRANAILRDRIRAIKGAPDSFKDSIWVHQWNTPDGPLFENQ